MEWLTQWTFTFLESKFKVLADWVSGEGLFLVCALASFLLYPHLKDKNLQTVPFVIKTLIPCGSSTQMTSFNPNYLSPKDFTSLYRLLGVKVSTCEFWGTQSFHNMFLSTFLTWPQGYFKLHLWVKSCSHYCHSRWFVALLMLL